MLVTSRTIRQSDHPVGGEGRPDVAGPTPLPTQNTKGTEPVMAIDETTRPFGISDSDHERRMDAARKRAEWELGDASWAGVIVGAYLYPNSDSEALKIERDA
jgi:hypothetical protein